jgi:hypothetical protein
MVSVATIIVMLNIVMLSVIMVSVVVLNVVMLRVVALIKALFISCPNIFTALSNKLVRSSK